MRYLSIGLVTACCCSCVSLHRDVASLEHGDWEQEIAAFEAQDRARPPAKGGVLFLGSSTIVGWDLDRHFPELHAVNRGFGGSEYADAAYYADRIVLPHRPSTVVVYSGDNDIANGKSPEQVFDDFKTLVRRIRWDLPNTRIVVLSIKPSIARWNVWEPMKIANTMIADYARVATRVDYVDISSALLGNDGRPRPELFQEDGLHLNAQGYEAISARLRPHLSDPGTP